jgi:hypothetical protein
MKKRLTEFLDPRTLKPTISDIAQAVKKPVEKVCIPAQEWKWVDIFYVIIEGEGALFGSYRALECWLVAVTQMLSNCHNYQTLAEMIAAVEWELQQNYRYSEEQKQRLESVLATQKARLEVLLAQAAGLIKAWEWAKAWEPLLKSCLNESTLSTAVKLYAAQKTQYQEYPEVLNFIVQVGRKQRMHLRNVEA